MNKSLIISLLVLTILCLFVLTGCTTTENARFKNIYTLQGEDGYKDYILVDTETNVMYWCHDAYQSTGLTVLVDSDGKPLLYTKSK